MDKPSYRTQGLTYRSSLSTSIQKTASASVCRNLRTLLESFDDKILSYKSSLPGEIDPSDALPENCAFITPQANALFPTGDFSVIVVPMVAGDVRGNRIGMGGGWFDKFLPIHPTATIIGCCYDEMVFDSIPSDPRDQKVDYICTEKRIIHCTVE